MRPEESRLDTKPFPITTGEELPPRSSRSVLTGPVRGLTSAEQDAEDRATDLEEMRQIIEDTPDPEERARLLREFQGSFLPGPSEPPSELKAAIDQINEIYKDNPTIRRKLVTDLMRGTLKGKKSGLDLRGLTSTDANAQRKAAIDKINKIYKDNPTIRRKLVRDLMKGTLKGDPALMGQIYTIKNGQAVLDPRVKTKISQMAKRLGGDPVELIKALIPESKMDSTEINTRSGASGLIQFTNTALNEMKRRNLIPKTVTLDSIRMMDSLEQLDLAEKYFQMHSGKADYSQPGEFSVAIFGPAGLGKPRSTVLYGGKTKAYTQNREVDAKDPKKRKGYITVDDYLKFKDRFVKSFQKKAKLPVFETKVAEPQKIEPIPEIAKSEPEVVESGIEDQTAQVGLPSDIPQDSMEMTRDQLDVIRGAAPGPAPSPEEAAQIMSERRREAALREQEEKKRRSADSMLRSLAKVGSFRDQQRYIEGTLRRGDLDANQVQALTMAAGLIRDRMQPRTLAEALYAAERGTTVGDLWYDKTMQGVTGATGKSSFTPYQQYRMARDEFKDERDLAKDRKDSFTKEVVSTRNDVRRLRAAYNKMKGDKVLESEILTNSRGMLEAIGRHEAEMNKILRDSRKPNANIEKLEDRFAKVNQSLTQAENNLRSVLGKSKSADRIEEYLGAPPVEEQGDVDAARQAMQ